MKIKIAKVLGVILSVSGFLGLFWVTEDSWTLQFIWTISAVIVLLLGQKLLEISGALKED